MTVPVGQGLFGECREAEKCICGLCADIEFESKRGRPKGKFSPEPTKTDDGVLYVSVKYRNTPPRKVHIKKPPAPRLPAPRLPLYDPAILDPCGCLIWKHRRIRWCDTLHTPQSHPNPCQHEHTSVQDFGLPTQRSVCLTCSNDISE